MKSSNENWRFSRKAFFSFIAYFEPTYVNLYYMSVKCQKNIAKTGSELKDKIKKGIS